ncbi:MAG: ribonuclease HI [Chlorobi bacterium]|nr:ribonuclease HI [Chlorobiota bacterium]
MSDYDFLVYTDGACIGNPGPGGWAAIIRDRQGNERIVRGSAQRTTNNRMELRALLEALHVLPSGNHVRVLVRTDSRHLVDAIAKGWAARWRQHGWKRNRRDRAENTDLWGPLLDELDRRTVVVEWTKGHNGDPLNERCDAIARAEAEHAVGTDDGYVPADRSTQQTLPLSISSAGARVRCTPTDDGRIAISDGTATVYINSEDVSQIIGQLVMLSRQ